MTSPLASDLSYRVLQKVRRETQSSTSLEHDTLQTLDPSLLAQRPVKRFDQQVPINTRRDSHVAVGQR